MSVICIFDPSIGHGLINTYAPNPTEWECTCKLGMPEIRGASGNELNGPETVILHLRMLEIRSWVTAGGVDKLAVPYLVPSDFTSYYNRSLHSAEQPIVPHHSLPVPVLMLHDSSSAAVKSKSAVGQKRHCATSNAQ